MRWAVLVWVLLQQHPGPQASLQEAVRGFWEAVIAHDRVRAMQFVHPKDLNRYLNQQDPAARAWRLQKIESIGPDQAAVRLGLQQIVQGRALWVVVRQDWEKVDGSWKLRVADLYRLRREAARRRGPLHLPPELTVVPREMRIYRIARPPRSGLTILNGLKSQASLEKVELDRSLFQVIARPETIPAGGAARLILEYIGESREKNLQSRIRITIRQQGKIRQFSVPILYNYSDRISDWLARQPTPKPPGR